EDGLCACVHLQYDGVVVASLRGLEVPVLPPGVDSRSVIERSVFTQRFEALDPGVVEAREASRLAAVHREELSRALGALGHEGGHAGLMVEAGDDHVLGTDEAGGAGCGVD